jgi:putative peptidoglycan lipid II flippase
MRSTIFITIFALASQVVRLFIQAVIASFFGATEYMDAYFAANTLPQFLLIVMVGTLGTVIIPIFVQNKSNGDETSAWKIANTVATVTGIILIVLALVGFVFAKPLLRISTPGLSEAGLSLAVVIARLVWPTIIATGLVTLFTGIFQAEEKFFWPAAIPLISACVNLGAVFVLAKPFGLIGVAIAAFLDITMQAVWLLALLLRKGKFRPQLALRHPGVRELYFLLIPLVASSLFTRWTPVLDRFLASQLSAGSISHLGYSYRLVAMISGLLSIGIPTVIYPRLALSAAQNDIASLRKTFSQGLRMMWLMVCPVTTIAISLSLPIVRILFERGLFNIADSTEVALLAKIYLLSVVGGCIGSVTGRVFYAMKATKLIAIVSVIESVLYAAYATILMKNFGAAGIASALAIYVDVSIVWQCAVLWFKLGKGRVRSLPASFLRTTVASVVAGLASYGTSVLISNPWLKTITGGIIGIAVLYAGLKIMRSDDIRVLETSAQGLLVRIRKIATLAR